MISALGDKERYVRRAAAEALGKLGDVRAVEPLISVLGDIDADACRMAAESLGKFGDKRAVGPLITALEPRENWRNLIRHKMDESDWSRVKEAQRDEDSRRSAIACALGELRDPHAIEPLTAALADKCPKLREAAANALAHLGQPKWATLARGDEKDLARLAGSGDRGAVDIAIKALGDQDWGTRQNSATALGGSSGRYAVEPLIKALGDPVDGVRQAAAKSLARLGEPRWISLIQGDHRDFSRLGDLGDPRASNP